MDTWQEGKEGLSCLLRENLLSYFNYMLAGGKKKAAKERVEKKDQMGVPRMGRMISTLGGETVSTRKTFFSGRGEKARKLEKRGRDLSEPRKKEIAAQASSLLDV